jgi:hypothetical protein
MTSQIAVLAGLVVAMFAWISLPRLRPLLRLLPVVALAPRMFKIAPQQVTSAIALITASAITFDSAAFALSPTLYAADQASAVIAASQIFWGGAGGLFMALLVEQRALR